MSTSTLFDLTFLIAAPFWALMVLAPRWTWTRRIMASPWVPLLPLAVYFAVALPHFGELWAVVSTPELNELRGFLGQPYGAAAIWAHLIAFDLFVARWMYRQGRARGIPALVVSPVLVLTLFLSPFGLVIFLVLRRWWWPRSVAADDARTAVVGEAGRA